MNEMPDSPLTSVEEGAVAAHEMYLAMCKAGFSEDQALILVSNVLNNSMNRQLGGQ